MAVANPADNVSNYKISTKAGKRPKSRRGGWLPLAYDRQSQAASIAWKDPNGTKAAQK